MAVAAVGDQLFGVVKRFLDGIEFVHGENGGELLVSEFFAEIHALYLADQDLRILRDFHAAELRDFVRALTDDLRVQRAVDDDGLAHLVQLVGL